MCTIAWPIQAQPSLEWKTRPRLSPVSLSLSMTLNIPENINVKKKIFVSLHIE